MMRLRVLAVALALLMLAPVVMGQSIDEPRFVNKLLGDFSTPSIVPGRSGVFSLTVNHPDPLNLTLPLENVTLHLSIYRYVTLDESLSVLDDGHNWPVISGAGGSGMTVDCGSIVPGQEYPVEFTIETGKDTPHGSYFSQSTYLVRFRLDLTYDGMNYSFASRGYFNDSQWSHLTDTGTGAGQVNRTYLAELGYDGIIPDSAFSVRAPIPRWPQYLLAVLTGLFAFLAFASHVLDSPGRYPRLEKRLLRLRGWLLGCWLPVRRRLRARGRKR